MTLSTIVSRALAPLCIALSTATHAADAPLQFQVYNADANSFHANAVLITGQHDAVLFDTGFTRADAYRIAAMVLDSQKTLKTIYISQADPDYYFGTAVLHDIFPNADIVATAPTVKKIEETLPKKLSVWSPRMGNNAPQNPIIPKVMQGDTLQLEGNALQIKGLDDALPHRSYVWIPALKAIAGGVNVFANIHAWVADTKTPEERAAWQLKLKEMHDLQPAVVIPGHMTPNQPLDASQIAYTQQYLRTFEQQLNASKDAHALIEKMQKAYPNAGLPIALDIGAKVTKGEMQW